MLALFVPPKSPPDCCGWAVVLLAPPNSPPPVCCAGCCWPVPVPPNRPPPPACWAGCCWVVPAPPNKPPPPPDCCCVPVFPKRPPPVCWGWDGAAAVDPNRPPVLGVEAAAPPKRLEVVVPWAGCACDDPNNPPPAAGAGLLLCPLSGEDAGISIGDGLRRVGFNTNLGWHQGGDDMTMATGASVQLGDNHKEERGAYSQETVGGRRVNTQAAWAAGGAGEGHDGQQAGTSRQGESAQPIAGGRAKTAKNLMRGGGGVLREGWTKGWCGGFARCQAWLFAVSLSSLFRTALPGATICMGQAERQGRVSDQKAGGASASR